MLWYKIFATLVFASWLAVGTGCARFERANNPDTWTADQFLNKARSALNNENYEQAIDYYQQLEGRFPYGSHAEQAQLETTFAYYRSGERGLAMAAADRFLQMHPAHPQVDYAYYLKGVSGFERPTGLTALISGADPSTTDTTLARESFSALRELTTRFPNSRYAKDASVRMTQILDVLAMQDIGIARYYLSVGAYIASINRAKYVIQKYQETKAIEHALGVMATAYERMGLEQLRFDTLRILRLNYPDSHYLKSS